MPKVIFIHSAGPQGEGEGSSAFLARLRERLGADFAIEAPLMPDPDAPEAQPWLDALGGAVAAARAPFALVGHSLGGSTILQYLALNPLPEGLAGVVSVAAPFWGAPDWNVPDYALPEDGSARLKDVAAITMLFGSEDETVGADHLDLYLAAIPNAEGRIVKGDHEFATGDIGAVADAIRSLFGFGTS